MAKKKKKASPVVTPSTTAPAAAAPAAAAAPTEPASPPPPETAPASVEAGEGNQLDEEEDGEEEGDSEELEEPTPAAPTDVQTSGQPAQPAAQEAPAPAAEPTPAQPPPPAAPPEEEQPRKPVDPFEGARRVWVAAKSFSSGGKDVHPGHVLEDVEKAAGFIGMKNQRFIEAKVQLLDGTILPCPQVAKRVMDVKHGRLVPGDVVPGVRKWLNFNLLRVNNWIEPVSQERLVEALHIEADHELLERAQDQVDNGKNPQE